MKARTVPRAWLPILFTMFSTFVCFAHAAAQAKGPDLLGLYLGMPDEQARKVLQSQSSVERIYSIPTQPGLFSLTMNNVGGAMADVIRVMTTAPAKPAAVWHVTRTLDYGDPAMPMAKSAMMNVLRQKYGKETAAQQLSANISEVWWLFDRDGRPAPSGDLRMMKACHGAIGFVTTREVAQASARADLKECFSSYTALQGRFMEVRPDILQNAEFVLVSLPIGYQGAVAVAKGNMTEAERKQREELEKAREARPKF